MLTSVLALSAIIYKNGRLLNLLNGSRKWKTNSNNFHRRNAKKKNYIMQETEVGMPCSREELEEFVVRVESSKNREEGVMKAPVFSSPWPGRPVEEEGNEWEYDKPRSSLLKVSIPIEIEPNKTEPGAIEDNKKYEKTYLDMSSSSSSVKYANCRRDAVFLPTPPPYSKQQGGQEYERMCLEHIYDSIDSMKKEDFLTLPKTGRSTNMAHPPIPPPASGPDGNFPYLADG